ncbi:hypothetical protein Tco_1561484 [Tanacetum coccineum]
MVVSTRNNTGTSNGTPLVLDDETRRFLVEILIGLVQGSLATVQTQMANMANDITALSLQNNQVVNREQTSDVDKDNVDYRSSGRLCNLSFLEYLKLYFFKYEHVAVNSTPHRLDAATIGKPASSDRIQKNLLGRVSQMHYPFSLPKRLKANNTVRVNRISIVIVNAIRYHSDVLAISQG